MEQVWALAKEWNDNYNGWKSSVFKTLETKDMDDMAQVQFKKITKFSKELRVSYLICKNEFYYLSVYLLHFLRVLPRIFPKYQSNLLLKE